MKNLGLFLLLLQPSGHLFASKSDKTKKDTTPTQADLERRLQNILDRTRPPVLHHRRKRVTTNQMRKRIYAHQWQKETKKLEQQPSVASLPSTLSSPLFPSPETLLYRTPPSYPPLFHPPLEEVPLPIPPFFPPQVVDTPFPAPDSLEELLADPTIQDMLNQFIPDATNLPFENTPPADSEGYTDPYNSALLSMLPEDSFSSLIPERPPFYPPSEPLNHPLLELPAEDHVAPSLLPEKPLPLTKIKKKERKHYSPPPPTLLSAYGIHARCPAPKCPHLYSTTDSVNKHLEKDHREYPFIIGQTFYQCEKCSHMIVSPDGVLPHIKENHPEEFSNPHQCFSFITIRYALESRGN